MTKIRKVFPQQQQQQQRYLFLFSPAQLCFLMITMWGVGSVFESKIVAFLNRQLWLLCFCPPLNRASLTIKKRHKKESIFAFKIYFWCCLKQRGEGGDCEALALGNLRFFLGGFAEAKCLSDALWASGIFPSLWYLKQIQKLWFKVVFPLKSTQKTLFSLSARESIKLYKREFLESVEALWSSRTCSMCARNGWSECYDLFSAARSFFH